MLPIIRLLLIKLQSRSDTLRSSKYWRIFFLERNVYGERNEMLTEFEKIVHTHIHITRDNIKDTQISTSSGSVVDLLVETQSNSLPFKLSASLSIHILFFQNLLSIDPHEFAYS